MRHFVTPSLPLISLMLYLLLSLRAATPPRFISDTLRHADADTPR